MKLLKSNHIPLYVIAGTRAQFIKLAPLLNVLETSKLNYKLLYTAQHKESITTIFQTYNIQSDYTILYCGKESNTKLRLLVWLLYMLYIIIFKSRDYVPKRGIVLTHGDTISTLLAAIMGKLRNCQIAHVESGLRSYNLLNPFPEELCRLLTFFLSDIYFCSNQWAISNLKRFKGEKINIGNNTLYDSVCFALSEKKKTQYTFQENKYVIASIHRYENIFSQRLKHVIIPYLKFISKKFTLVFVLHPSTRERLKQLSLYDDLSNTSNIILHERFEFVDWINICKGAEFVVTDGGSNQEEMSYLGVPTLLFRQETERKEGLGSNVVLSRLDKRSIETFIIDYKMYRNDFVSHSPSPCKVIVEYLKRTMCNGSIHNFTGL